MMKITKTILIFLFFLFYLSSIPVFSKVTITDTTGTFTPLGIDELEAELQDMMDVNGIALADSAAFSNIQGYPVGKSILKGFPRFFIGMNFSGSFGNLTVFDNSKHSDENMIPVGSFNPVFLFGLGLKKRLDIMLKLMIFNSALYKPPLNYSIMTLKEMSVYSFGVKVRYNISQEIKVLPGIFNFGGLSLGVSVDYMYGLLKVTGSMEYPAGTLSIAAPPAGNFNCTYAASYGGRAEWTAFSVNPEIVVHLNLFAIFDVYTGFGFPIHYTTLDIEFNSRGDVLADGRVPELVGSIAADGSDGYIPFFVQPVWLGGIEINVYILRLTFETMVNIYNRKDISMVLGARTQW